MEKIKNRHRYKRKAIQHNETSIHEKPEPRKRFPGRLFWTVAAIAGAFVVLLLFVRAATFTGAPPSSAFAASGDSLACVNTAVQAYQTAVANATAAYLGAVREADAARDAAFKQTSDKGVSSEAQTDMNAALAAYETAIQAAKVNWQSISDAALAEFQGAARACNAPPGILNGLHIPAAPPATE